MVASSHIKATHWSPYPTLSCMPSSQPPKPGPMCPTKLPSKRWSQFAFDVCGPFSTGEYIVVLTNYFSRWPEAKILKTVLSANKLKWLNEVFAQHGYPEVLWPHMFWPPVKSTRIGKQPFPTFCSTIGQVHTEWREQPYLSCFSNAKWGPRFQYSNPPTWEVRVTMINQLN